MSVHDEILGIIGNNCAAEERLLSENSLFGEISIDSLSFVEMIVELEDRYDIRFAVEELNIFAFKKVKDFIDVAERHINKNIN